MRTIYTSEYKEIIERLRKARIEKGLTQLEVSNKLKRGQSFVSKIERRQRRLDVLEMKELASIYGLSVSKFYDE